jgi:hypothetical protein
MVAKSLAQPLSGKLYRPPARSAGPQMVAEPLSTKLWARPDLRLEAQSTPFRDDLAICFTGGGSRAYVAALGQLAALRQLGLLEHARTIAAVSGGAWATAAYCFGQQPESQLLGDIIPPAKLTWPTLREPPLPAYGAVVRASFAGELARATVGGAAPFAAWREAVHRCILDPIGVPSDCPISWSAQTVADIRRRCPSLSDTRFVTCPPRRPLPLLGAALLGPASSAPFALDTREFTMLEVTPLYAGVATAQRCTEGSTVGGYVEPFAWGAAPRGGGLKPFARRAVSPIDGLADSPPLSLESALAASSFFVGANLASAGAADGAAPAAEDGAAPDRRQQLRRTARRTVRRVTAPRPALLRGAASAVGAAVTAAAPSLGASVDYWSPLDAEPRATPYLLGDGGSVANPPLISLLQRRYSRVLCCVNVGDALPPLADWDPYDPAVPVHPSFSDDLPAFFGLAHPSTSGSPNANKQTERNHVFATADFAPMIRALQRAQAEGAGAVATVEHVTVANAWWGVPAGRKVRVTWSYICRAPKWEAALPADVREALPDAKGGAFSAARASTAGFVASVVRQVGPGGGGDGVLDGFPQYPLTRLQLSAEQATALFQLSGWCLLQRGEALKEALLESYSERIERAFEFGE